MKINLKEIAYLNGNDVISAQVSDHHPLLRNGVLFWNVMMQGRKRISLSGDSYNNGFGFIENDKQYKNRLMHVANVIGEIVTKNPTIYAIGLCEGPIQQEHVNVFIETLRQHDSLKRFINHDVLSFHRPIVDKTPNWGLMMFVDNRYQTLEVKLTLIEKLSVSSKLINRFQTWQLVKDDEVKYVSLAHFPFGGDEFVTQKNQLSTHGKIYSQLVNHLLEKNADNEFAICADFNFNPHLLGHRNDRVLDEVANNNSIVLTPSKDQMKQIREVTVDGILFTHKSKQKIGNTRFNDGLFSRLKREHQLTQSQVELKIRKSG